MLDLGHALAYLTLALTEVCVAQCGGGERGEALLRLFDATEYLC